MTNLLITKLRGPIAVFGAGGFVGSHLLNTLVKHRDDVIGFSQNPANAWRLKKLNISNKFIAQCDLLDAKNLSHTIKKYKPQSIFNLAAYGAYSWQTDVQKIYETNFASTILLIEELKKQGFSMYVHAGSQSEYGHNAAGPKEEDILIPNSHYAVSKAAVYNSLVYYGKTEKLPVVHLRLYSVYGPLEEPGRLIPTLIEHAKRGALPSFVSPDISRDFIYVDDVVEAFITVAAKAKSKHFGEPYNVATGIRTTMKDLALLSTKMFSISAKPQFSTMKERSWDVADWYGNPKKIQKDFEWIAKTSLEKGLKKCHEFELKNADNL